MIYIASPYSDDDSNVRMWRFVQACKYSAMLFSSGRMAFSPIAHSHPMAVYGVLDVDFETWREFDLEMMGNCDSVHVLKLPGWARSNGVCQEILHANKIGIPVDFIEYNTPGRSLTRPAESNHEF